MDLIDRQAAIKLIHTLYPSAPIMRINRKRWEKKYKPYIEAEKALEMLPSAQPERPKGKWIWKLDEGDPDRSMMLVCSKCGNGRNKVGIYNFCNICGTEMINPEPINQW